MHFLRPDPFGSGLKVICEMSIRNGGQQMNKRIVCLLMAILMTLTAAAVTGCGAKDKAAALAGTWESATCIHEGKEANTNDIWGEFTIVFNEDKTAKVVFMGLESKGEVSENEDGTFNLVTDDFTDVTLTEDGDQLKMEFAEDTIIFERCEDEH